MATQLVVRGLDESLVQALEEKARRAGQSREEWVRQALAAYLDRAELIKRATLVLWATTAVDVDDAPDNLEEFNALANLIGSAGAEGVEAALLEIRARGR